MVFSKWKKSKGKIETSSNTQNNNNDEKNSSYPSSDGGSIYSIEALQYTGLRTTQQLVKRRDMGEKVIIEKPWLSNKRVKKADKWLYRLFVIIISLGVVGMFAGIALKLLTFIKAPKYCIVLDENFSDGLDKSVWSHEQQIGGFWTNEFDWTTDNSTNSFVEDGKLYIVPTYTSDSFGNDPNVIFNGQTLNLTQKGSCTATTKDDLHCAAHSNQTLGTVLPPIQSARLTTNLSHTIRFGKVEVKAKMPSGDYLWPSIRMLPSENVYGEFPASGGISIFEGRGNQAKRQSDDMNNLRVSGLHWGPENHLSLDRFSLTSAFRRLTHKLYDQSAHTFGLEWNDEQINLYEGNSVRSVYFYTPKDNFWKFGNFPQVVGNTTIEDPWKISGSEQDDKMAPFDQQFYLSLGVGVGGTSGWFPDSVYPTKPWSDSQPKQAAGDFWRGRSEWQKTWPTDLKQRAMVYVSNRLIGKLQVHNH